METKICQECKKEKRSTLFSLVEYEDENGEEVRMEVCRACRYDGFYANEPHKILREAYRNYQSWRDLITYDGIEMDVIEYAVPPEKGSDEYVTIRISFTALSEALQKYVDGKRMEGTVLSKRKEQAFRLNVLEDMLQRDVAEIMGITTVSVGQYVEQAMLQLCDYYFAEQKEDTTMDTGTGEE